MKTNHLGKHMRHALTFATNNPGWHTFNIRCNSTVNAIRRLVNRGLVETNCVNQFRLVNN